MKCQKFICNQCRKEVGLSEIVGWLRITSISRCVGFKAIGGTPVWEKCQKEGHKWRETSDWKIDKCARCGEERA